LSLKSLVPQMVQPTIWPSHLHHWGWIFIFFFLINMGRRKMGKYNIKEFKGTHVRLATPTKECKQSKDGATRK
jgi:hypothetical protein